jgi:hypothetical protein
MFECHFLDSEFGSILVQVDHGYNKSFVFGVSLTLVAQHRFEWLNCCMGWYVSSKATSGAWCLICQQRLDKNGSHKPICLLLISLKGVVRFPK